MKTFHLAILETSITKALYILILLFFAASSTSAQELKAKSVYDIDSNDSITVADATSVVNRLLELSNDDKTVVDTESLLTVLNSINERLTNIEGSLSSLSTIGGSTIADTHEYVDLGLPSGTLWASCNVGAGSSTDYGCYFAWGETTTKLSYNYDLSNYKYYDSDTKKYTKYCCSSGSGTVDNKTQLDLEDDAAYVNWGENWRIPTAEEWTELVNSEYTTVEWKDVGYYGCKITSLKNGNSIYLPAAGYAVTGNQSLADVFCYYRTSNLTDSTIPTDAKVFSTGILLKNEIKTQGRSWGLPVRPVYRKYR